MALVVIQLPVDLEDLEAAVVMDHHLLLEDLELRVKVIQVEQDITQVPLWEAVAEEKVALVLQEIVLHMVALVLNGM